MSKIDEQYTGFYDSCSNKNPVQVWIVVARKRHRLGNLSTVEEGLEVYNNAAFWLSEGPWGLHIPLQGPQELQDRYCKDTHYQHAENIPPANEVTDELLAWAEKSLKKVEARNFSVGMVPSKVLQVLRSLGAELQAIRVRYAQEMDAWAQRSQALENLLDPELIEAIRSRDILLASRVNAKPEHYSAYDKELENLYTKFPAARPS